MGDRSKSEKPELTRHDYRRIAAHIDGHENTIRDYFEGARKTSGVAAWAIKRALEDLGYSPQSRRDRGCSAG